MQFDSTSTSALITMSCIHRDLNWTCNQWCLNPANLKTWPHGHMCSTFHFTVTLLLSSFQHCGIHLSSDYTFWSLSFSWLPEYVSSSISESPLSEDSGSLGISCTFWAFLVLGGRAGGVPSWVGWAAGGPSGGGLRWKPLSWAWGRLVLSVWELFRLSWRRPGGDTETLGAGGGGLGDPAFSSDDESKSASVLWAAMVTGDVAL